MGYAVATDGASPRLSPTATAPPTHDQQIVIVMGLSDKTRLGFPNIHNDAHGNACGRSAESLVNAGDDESFRLAVA